MEQEEPNTTQTPNKAQNKAGNQLVFAYGSQKQNQYSAKGKDGSTPVNLTSFFSSLSHQIFTIACGAFHTLVLTTNGEVYSFGSNQDGALGRTGNATQLARVEFDTPIDQISAGETHSVACNSNSSLVYHWGTYYNASKGVISKAETPQAIGEGDWRRKKIQKVISGAHHTLALVEGKIYAWGDAEVGILGRVSTSRRKLEQGLKIEGMGVKGAVDDIYTGAYHAFLKKTEKKKNETFTAILAWGQNESGQLGLGHTNSTHLPTEVVELRGKNVRNITGGVHHTVVLTDEGVLSFGRNEEGQLGLGKDFEEPVEEVPEEPEEKKTPKVKAPPKNNKKSSKKGKSSKKPEKEEEKGEEGKEDKEGEAEKKEEEKPEETKETKEAEPEPEKVEEKKEANKSKGKAKGKATQEKEEVPEEPLPRLITKPCQVELENVERIYSGSEYNYAITKDNEIYSWGAGTHFLLGNKSEEVAYTPAKLDAAGLFEGKKVAEFALGWNHVIVLANESGNPAAFDEEVLKKEDAKSTKKGGATTTGGKKAAGTTGKKGKGKMEEEAPEEEAEDVKKDLSKSLEEKDDKKKSVGKRKGEEEPEAHDLKKVKKASTGDTDNKIDEEKPEEKSEEPSTTVAETTTENKEEAPKESGMAVEKEEESAPVQEEKAAIQEEKPAATEEKPAETTETAEKIQEEGKEGEKAGEEQTA